MRPRIELVLLVVGALALEPAPVRAQACCSGANTVSPARLAAGEELLVAVQVKAGVNTGSFDARGDYLSAPDGTLELDLEQDLIVAVQAVEGLQLAVLLPIRETVRQFPGISESGGGLGDLNLALRCDFTHAGGGTLVPGIAALAGITVPTGTPPDRAEKTLNTDATGIGATQLSAGLALEQIFARHFLVNLSGILSERLPRDVGSIREHLGLTGALTLSFGYIFDRNHGIALVLHHESEADARIGGVLVPESGRRTTSVGVAAGFRLADAWRMQASLVAVPPLGGLGKNQLAAETGTLTLIYTRF